MHTIVEENETCAASQEICLKVEDFLESSEAVNIEIKLPSIEIMSEVQSTLVSDLNISTDTPFSTLMHQPHRLNGNIQLPDCLSIKVLFILKKKEQVKK